MYVPLYPGVIVDANVDEYEFLILTTTPPQVLGKLLRMSLGTAAITTVLVIMDALSFLFNNTTSNFFVLTGLIISRAYTCCVL